MNRILFTFISFFALCGLVACATPPVVVTEPVIEQPTLIPTLLPTVEATPTPELPTPEPIPTPEPTVMPTQVSPTVEPEPTSWKPASPGAPCEPSDTRTCNILYIFTDQYDDEHVIKVGPSLKRAGYTTYLASDTLEEIRGFHECYDFTPATPDMLLEDVVVADYDAILFLGSDGWSTALHSDPAAHRIAREAFEQWKVVVAIGDGPVILARAGLLAEKTVTVKKDVYMHGIADQWYKAILREGAIYTDRSPVRDGLLITADLASIRVAWAIIEVLEEQFQ